MKKIYLLLLCMTFLFSCQTAQNYGDSSSISGVLKLVSENSNSYIMTLDSYPEYMSQNNGTVMIQLHEGSKSLNNFGSGIQRGSNQINFQSGYTLSENKKIGLTIIFDKNKNYVFDMGEVTKKLKNVSKSNLLQGINFEIQTNTPLYVYKSEKDSENLNPTSTEEELSGNFKLISYKNNEYSLGLNISPPDLNSNSALIVQFFESGELVSGMGSDFQSGKIEYLFRSGYQISEEKTSKLEIFLDKNGNGNYDKGESQGIVKFEDLSELESGINVSFKNYDIEKEKQFIRPNNQYDLSMNPSPPEGFEKKEGLEGIGLIDFNYSEPLWFYQETTLEQIIELVGSEPTDNWNSDGSADSRTFKFDLPDGGIVMFGFDGEGLWMVYPRHTTRFTLIGYPRLPWSKDTVSDIFGLAAGYKLTKDDEVIFVGVGSEPGMTGFRLDSKDMMGDGFRIWIKE